MLFLVYPQGPKIRPFLGSALLQKKHEALKICSISVYIICDSLLCVAHKEKGFEKPANEWQLFISNVDLVHFLNVREDGKPEI